MGRIENDAAFFMSYVQGEDRGQAALLPAAIGDVPAANRVIILTPRLYLALSGASRTAFSKAFRAFGSCPWSIKAAPRPLCASAKFGFRTTALR